LIIKAWQLTKNSSDRLTARDLFKYSILYLMLLCIAMGVDSLPVTDRLIDYLTIKITSLIWQ
jgi:heme o synthase